MPTIKIGPVTVSIATVPLSDREVRHMRAALSFYTADETPDRDTRTRLARAIEAYISSTGAAAQDLLEQARTWSPRKAEAVLRQAQEAEVPR